MIFPTVSLHEVQNTHACVFFLQVIPLPRQQFLLQLVVGRVQDKSTFVRRSCVQLLTALLRGNPFAAKVRPMTVLRSFKCYHLLVLEPLCSIGITMAIFMKQGILVTTRGRFV